MVVSKNQYCWYHWYMIDESILIPLIYKLWFNNPFPGIKDPSALQFVDVLLGFPNRAQSTRGRALALFSVWFRWTKWTRKHHNWLVILMVSPWGDHENGILMVNDLNIWLMILITGWWLTYPSEKWWSSSVGMVTFPTEWKVIKFHGSKPPTR